MEHGPRYRYALEKGMSTMQHSYTRARGDRFVSVGMPSLSKEKPTLLLAAPRNAKEA